MGTGGNVASGGRVESRGTGGSSANAGSGGSTASAGTVSEGGSGGAPGGAHQADPCVENQTCPLNTWIDVTPEGIVIPDPGLRSVVGNTAVPSEIFMGAGEAGIWKSEDYGNTWTMVNPGFGYVPQGLCFAVLPSQPATLLVAAAGTDGTIHKSTDAGATWYDTGGDLPSQLYSLTVDPYDSNHIISGFHEADGVAESPMPERTWHVVGTTGFPMGGISWYPFFIDTGAAGHNLPDLARDRAERRQCHDYPRRRTQLERAVRHFRTDAPARQRADLSAGPDALRARHRRPGAGRLRAARDLG